ncbi:MAG: SMC family ATPase [Chloroflexi bacterium]|nr:SMC family ATPase [Chloroflexota bacterium]
MCYKNASLDLNGVHLACLSGDNGAGKSALFDAMTWAVWGKSRTTSTDDLIAQGENEMQVIFDFSCDNQLYRVKRIRNKKVNKTVLSFTLQNGEQWRDITENTAPTTQKKIIEILRMKYETFINSAFLKQGKADEFTVKTPSERKEVLAEILGLGQFDDLEKKAKERVKDAKTELTQLDAKLKEIEGELHKRPGYEAQKNEAELQLQECSQRLLNNRKTLAEMQGEEARLKEKENALRQAEARLVKTQEQLRKVKEEQAKVRHTLSDSQKILAQRTEIEQGYAELQQVGLEIEAFNTKATSHLNLERQKVRLSGIVTKERALLEANITTTHRKVEEAKVLKAGLERYEADFAKLQEELALSIAASEDLSKKQAEAQTHKAEIKQTEAEAKRAKQELSEIEAKAKRVPKPGDVCDRCGTLLSDEAQKKTIEQYREEYRTKQKECKDIQERLERLQAILGETEEAIKPLEKPARNCSLLVKQVGGLEEKIKQAHKASEELLATQAMLESFTQDLNTKQYALVEQRQLDEIQGELKALNYDQKAHDIAKTQQRELKRFEEQKNELWRAEEKREWAEKDLARLVGEEKRLGEEESESKAEVERLKVEATGLQQLRERIKAGEKLVSEAEGQEKLIRANLLRAETSLEFCAKQELKKKECQRDQNQANQTKIIYGELTEAFGKKGIQALVMDTVLPELEEESNHLLGEMSDGRMSVRFETQRDSKKGEPIETLDLRISDEQGSRPYEMFSGGEAFRINFAVRVALSKLLARRSGAQLRTLIIDEGFGSQDGQGRERLVEAIRGIENDFERVLVITHLQELKDVFPVRIDVVKTATGTQLSIN